MEIPGHLSVRARASGALLVVAAALVGGCASGSGGGPVAGGSCPVAPGVTPHQVNFGLLYPATGLNAQALSPYRAGVDARLGLANAHGGVNGRTVAYDWADDQGQPQANLAAAERLVTTDSVLAIQEFSSSPQGSAAWLNAQAVPVVGTSDDVVWSQYPNMFSYFNLITSSADSITTWGDFAKSEKVKKAAILVSQASAGSPTVGADLRTSLEAAGIPTMVINAEPNMIDIPTITQQIESSGADLITGVVDPAEFIRIALAARTARPKIKILSLTGYDAGIFAVGKQLAGMAVALDYTPFEHPIPAHQAFFAAMAQYAPQQQPAATQVALIGWVDTDLMLRGLQAAGPCPTRQSFMANLRGVSNFSADGLLANPVDMRTVFGRLTLCYSFLKIGPNGDRFVPVGGRPFCGQPIR